jgi:RHS repeat-associated protein
MEKDDELKGTGNSYDFGARMYDPRVGRWLSIDPLASNYPSESPYSAFRNSPILYFDQDGKEWVNAHTARVSELNKIALDNPNDKKIQRDLKNERKNETKVATYIKTIQENDVALYNYIDQLKVEKINGEKVNVKVNVSIAEYDFNQKQDGMISYDNSNEFVNYPDKEGNVGYFAPVSKGGEIGFDVILNGKFSFHDVTLSNEAGDVMYRMEYPQAAYRSGTDKGKNYQEYMKPGGPGYYSTEVEETYKTRKGTPEGKDPNNNPYPLENKSKEKKK